MTPSAAAPRIGSIRSRAACISARLRSPDSSSSICGMSSVSSAEVISSFLMPWVSFTPRKSLRSVGSSAVRLASAAWPSSWKSAVTFGSESSELVMKMISFDVAMPSGGVMPVIVMLPLTIAITGVGWSRKFQSAAVIAVAVGFENGVPPRRPRMSQAEHARSVISGFSSFASSHADGHSGSASSNWTASAQSRSGSHR